MKKMIKLSLVAAVAVAGLTTSATAGSLEEAIKGVTISGQMNVEYENQQTKVTNTAKTNTNQREYDFDVTANIPVNDMITAQIGFQADKDVGENTATGNNTFDLTKLNFTAKTDVATVIVGKQKQPTPFLDDERGDGIVALIPAGPVTLAAGHFTGMIGGQEVGTSGLSSELDERDIAAAAIIGTFGPVNAQAWYLQASQASTSAATLEKGVEGYSINLAADIEGFKVELNHAQTELQNEGATNWGAESLTKLTVATAVAGVNLVAGYGMTNDNDDAAKTNSTVGSRALGADLTSDNDAKNNFAMDQLALDDLNDASAFLIGASVQAGAYNVGVAYLDGDSTTGTAKTDISELDLTVSYAMSKNFTLKGIYAMDEVKTTASKTENDTLTLRATYKF